MFYDDLPIWGFIGKVEKILQKGEKPQLRFYLFTHIHFEILYNDNRVIEVNVSTDPTRTKDITEAENRIVDFTYSVKWRETPVTYDRRMEKYSRYSFLPQHLEVHSTFRVRYSFHLLKSGVGGGPFKAGHRASPISHTCNAMSLGWCCWACFLRTQGSKNRPGDI